LRSFVELLFRPTIKRIFSVRPIKLIKLTKGIKKTKKDKKVQSKARVLTQGDVDILRQEEEERKAK
jgi:hypothetical protein